MRIFDLAYISEWTYIFVTKGVHNFNHEWNKMIEIETLLLRVS